MVVVRALRCTHLALTCNLARRRHLTQIHPARRRRQPRRCERRDCCRSTAAARLWIAVRRSKCTPVHLPACVLGWTLYQVGQPFQRALHIRSGHTLCMFIPGPGVASWIYADVRLACIDDVIPCGGPRKHTLGLRSTWMRCCSLGFQAGANERATRFTNPHAKSSPGGASNWLGMDGATHKCPRERRRLRHLPPKH